MIQEIWHFEKFLWGLGYKYLKNILSVFLFVLQRKGLDGQTHIFVSMRTLIFANIKNRV